MKQFFLIILIGLGGFGMAQTGFDLEFPTTYKETTYETNANFLGSFNLDNDTVYNLEWSAQNVELPDGWYFTLCNPFLCAAPDSPSMVFEYDGNEFSSGDVSCKITTSDNPSSIYGELDLVLKNLDTNDSIVTHIVAEIKSLMSINDINQDHYLLYPNPVVESLTITFDDNAKYLVQILTIGGDLVKEKVFINDGVFDMTDLDKGTYFVKINSGTLSRIERVVKL